MEDKEILELLERQEKTLSDVIKKLVEQKLYIKKVIALKANKK